MKWYFKCFFGKHDWWVLRDQKGFIDSTEVCIECADVKYNWLEIYEVLK